MDDSTKRELGLGWDRTQLSLRLTTERKAELLALCSALGPMPTPTDAIDRALEIARQAQWEQGRESIGADDIEAAVEASMTVLNAALERQGRDIDQIASSLRGLHRLMSAVAQETDSAMLSSTDAQPQAPIAFRKWLEQALLRSGDNPQRAVVARSTWQRLVRQTPRLSSLDLMAELVAIDGALVPKVGADGYPEISRIELIDSAHPVCAMKIPRPIFLVCQVVPGGWIAHAHHATADGQPGDAIGSHRI